MTVQQANPLTCGSDTSWRRLSGAGGCVDPFGLRIRFWARSAVDEPGLAVTRRHRAMACIARLIRSSCDSEAGHARPAVARPARSMRQRIGPAGPTVTA
ncbi:hypothetical protein C9J60_38940 [Streptomyces sp. A244]|nr:hypothetical protein C9J60_38940 [Streptomyces sp. A244]